MAIGAVDELDAAMLAASMEGRSAEAWIQKETGDVTRARVIRLVGDGLAGIEPAPTTMQVDALIDALIPQPGGAARQ